jgi:predicted nucleotidyltransferase component of viral defense system
MNLTANEAIEAFHLAFLSHLAKDPNKMLYVVKGGQNLRFFFGSIRHSDDLDMDVVVTTEETLKKKVDKILSSGSFKKNLLLYGIEVAETSTPKQTDTTQRWKMSLKVTGLRDLVPTRLEFSRRATDSQESVLGQVSKPIADAYRSSPFSVSHYKLSASIVQKIDAMAHRQKARDLFDLAMLLERHARDLGAVTAIHPAQDTARAALAKASAMTYAAYLAEVVPYLEKSQRKEHGSKQSWQDMTSTVIQALEIFSQ